MKIRAGDLPVLVLQLTEITMPNPKKFPALLLSAILLSICSTHPAHAQTKPGYIVVETEVLDAKAYQEYAKQVVPLVEKMGGQFLVRGGTSIPLAPAGAMSRRVSLIKFESKDKAQAFQDSGEFAKLKPARDKTTKTHSFIIEGTGP